MKELGKKKTTVERIFIQRYEAHGKRIMPMDLMYQLMRTKKFSTLGNIRKPFHEPGIIIHEWCGQEFRNIVSVWH